MPRPQSERQAWEDEHQELQAQLAVWQQDLAATPPEQRERRERLVWQIRRGQLRLATLETWLAAPPPRED